MKKFLNLFLCFAMLIGLSFSVKVSAAEKECLVSSDSVVDVTGGTKDEVFSEVQEDYERIVSLNMLQEGDVQVLGVWDGEVYCVEVVSVMEPPCIMYGLDNQVKTKTFLFTKTNVLGVKTKLMAVTATLKWIKNDKIISFECSKEVYNSLILASWEPGYISQTDGMWARVLNVVWENGNSESIYFIGGLMTIDGKDTVDISCSVSLEQ